MKAIPEEVREKELAPRTRKPLNEIVFAGSLQENHYSQIKMKRKLK